MSDKYRVKTIVSSILFINFAIMLILTACNPAQRPFPQTSPQGNVQPGQILPEPNPANSTGDATLGLQTPIVQASREQMLSYRIGNDLINMPEVDRVSVLIRGDSAIIGFVPSDGYNNVSAIRDAIINRVNSLNLPISRILASESSDVIIRINQINSDIINNRPISEVNASIDQLVNRIMPIVR